MTPTMKRELREAIKRAEELVTRNSCPYETVYGVLNCADARALVRLVGFAEAFLLGHEAKG